MKSLLLNMIEDYQHKIKACDTIIQETTSTETKIRVEGKKSAYSQTVTDLKRILKDYEAQ